MPAVSFFTAVIAAEGRAWRARDVDVEDCEDLDDLVGRMRGVAHDEEPVLCIIELEDGWFALIRADDDDSPTVFVSNMEAARLGHYGPVLAAAEDVDAVVPAGVHRYEREDPKKPATEDERLESELEHDLAAEAELEESLGGALIKPEPDGEPVDEWAGDPSVLTGFGVQPRDLVDLVEDNPDDPATVLAELGEKAGFGELLEALR